MNPIQLLELIGGGIAVISALVFGVLNIRSNIDRAKREKKAIELTQRENRNALLERLSTLLSTWHDKLIEAEQHPENPGLRIKYWDYVGEFGPLRAQLLSYPECNEVLEKVEEFNLYILQNYEATRYASPGTIEPASAEQIAHLDGVYWAAKQEINGVLLPHT